MSRWIKVGRMKVSGSVINVEVDGIGTWTLDPKDVGYCLANIEPQKVSGVLSSTQYADLSNSGTGVKVTIPGNNYPYVAIVWQVENMLSDITKKAALWMPINSMYRLTMVNEGTNEVLDSMRIWANVSPAGKLMVMRSGLNKGLIYEIKSWDTVTKIYKLTGKKNAFFPFSSVGNGYDGTVKTYNSEMSISINSGILQFNNWVKNDDYVMFRLVHLFGSGGLTYGATYECITYAKVGYPNVIMAGTINASTHFNINNNSYCRILVTVRVSTGWNSLNVYTYDVSNPKQLNWYGGISFYFKYFAGFQVRDLYQIIDPITNEYLEDIYPHA